MLFLNIFCAPGFIPRRTDAKTKFTAKKATTGENHGGIQDTERCSTLDKIEIFCPFQGQLIKMQSHLTRRVIRALVNNEPVRFPHCRARNLHTPRIRRVASGKHDDDPRFLNSVLGGFSPRSSQPPQQQDALSPEAGLKPMAELAKAQEQRSKAPKLPVLCQAFRDFFEARVGTPGVITAFHGRLLVKTWYHLIRKQDKLGDENWSKAFSPDILQSALYVLSETPILPEAHKSVQELARNVYSQLMDDPMTDSQKIPRQASLAYIRIMSITGFPEEAQRVVTTLWERLGRSKPSPWQDVIKGYALKGDLSGLQKALETAKQYDYVFDPALQEELVLSLQQENAPGAAEVVFKCPLLEGQAPTLRTKETMAKMAIMRGDLEAAGEVIRSLPPTPTPKTRDISLLWQAATQGSTAADLAKILDEWAAKNPELRQSLTISCVNDLIAYANAINDQERASDYSTLITTWDLQPDTQTITLLELEARMHASDVDGVVKTLQFLHERDALGEIPLPVTNQLITMLCLAEQTDAIFEQISNLLDPLVDNDVRIEPETAAALTLLLLRRGDFDGVSQFLRPRLGSYGAAERKPIITRMLKFIADRSQTDDAVWNAYEILRVAFPEIDQQDRTVIMNSFFDRGRVDRACTVFTHMRQSLAFPQRPTEETYMWCFLGIARCGFEPPASSSNPATEEEDANDVEELNHHLQSILNLLRLDLEVEPTTRVRNALMLALAACDRTDEAMEVFWEILRSEEGPSERTIPVFLRVCESHPTGEADARKMLDKMRVLEIPVTKQVLVGYARVFASRGDTKTTIEALGKMPASDLDASA